uniref:G protein-coupled receptor n=1 Tax=Panagrellus redivivus TaxID=6233 RepID=A0A7E4ZUU3_PANRE
MYINDPACAEYELNFVMTGIIVNTSLAIGTLFIIIFGIIKSPKVVDASTRAKIERKLIIHTCAQSIMLICWFGSIYLSIGLPNLSDEMFTFLDTLSTFLFFMQHYPPMLLPLFLK